MASRRVRLHTAHHGLECRLCLSNNMVEEWEVQDLRQAMLRLLVHPCKQARGLVSPVSRKGKHISPRVRRKRTLVRLVRPHILVQ